MNFSKISYQRKQATKRKRCKLFFFLKDGDEVSKSQFVQIKVEMLLEKNSSNRI